MLSEVDILEKTTVKECVMRKVTHAKSGTPGPKAASKGVARGDTRKV